MHLRLSHVAKSYKLNKNSLKHVAIILDGNGRWATNKCKNRTSGHEKGAKNVELITSHAAKIGLKYLTLYAFSTENWKRPKAEISFLMILLEKFLKSEEKILIENNIKFDTIGDISKFSRLLQKQIEKLKILTEKCTGLTQILALNYGSHDEIVRACKKVVESKEEITKESICKNLDTANFDEVDILIRTGGKIRLSNFLLWQCAYSELYFTDTLWPDFSKEEFDAIIDNFSTIKRNFGGL